LIERRKNKPLKAAAKILQKVRGEGVRNGEKKRTRHRRTQGAKSRPARPRLKGRGGKTSTKKKSEKKGAGKKKKKTVREKKTPSRNRQSRRKIRSTGTSDR